MKLSHHVHIRFTFYESPTNDKDPLYNKDTESPIYIVHDPPVVLSMDKKEPIPIEKVQKILKNILKKRFPDHEISEDIHIYPLTGLNTDQECHHYLKRISECREFCAIFHKEELHGAAK